MEILTGQSLKGYDLLNRIGSGGFGVVYRAYQSTIGREVAVKIVLPRFANHPDFIRHFAAEAQLIARLEHLHIVPLYDYWRDPGGTYLVMRWLRGGSVKDALTDGPFDLEPAAMLLDQVASGLAVAHSNGIVHRDLKPSNILLDEEGNGYLADFGIAKDLRQAAATSSEKEAIVGSLDYLSPEQARSEPVTAQSDIYSLGITLYEMLTGENPFHHLNTVERLYKHINDPLPRIETLAANVADEVNDVIQRATAKHPKHRFADALEMATAFRTAARLKQARETIDLDDLLTAREQDVLRLIVEGQTNQQIALNLYIEHSTVKWYVRQIYRKLGVRSRRQAMVLAREMNLLAPGLPADRPGEATSTSISVALPAPVNPYKGLRAFEAADRRDFFGREALVKSLLDSLTLPSTTGSRAVEPGEGRFLAVIGPSGSGKSSLVKAGLIPALRQDGLPGSERWFVVEMMPGTRPLDELEVALIRVAANQAENVRAQLERDRNGLLRASELILPRDNSELLLVIDQFEEMFTLVPGEADRAHFLDILIAAATDARSRVRIVLTLRADCYDRPLHYPELGQLVQSHMVTVMPLSARELEQTIARPAERVGVTYEPGLVSAIIDEALYQPGALPMLQYALTELFEQRDGRLLTYQAYKAIGGTTGALATRSEELYREQDSRGQEAIRQMFMRLVSVGQPTESLPVTRRRVPTSELLSLADVELMDELIDTYAAYRLLTLDHDPKSRLPTVEIAHEALLREWERLRLWLEDSRDDLYQHRRLQALTEEWAGSGRDPGLLLRETRLDQMAAWASSTDLALTGDESDFLKTSLDARQGRRIEEDTRRQRELETAQKLAETERRRREEQTEANLRLRRRAAGLTILLLVAIAAIFFAWQQNQQARQQARLATARELAAASISNLIVDPERSILLALKAAETTFAVNRTLVPEAEDALHRAVQASRVQFTVPGHGAVEYSPDGTRLATSSLDGAELWDATTGKKLLTLSGHVDQVLNLAFSEDGSRLATTSLDNTVSVWDTVTGERLLTAHGPLDPEELMSPALNTDGSLLAVTGSDGAVRIWQVPSGQSLMTLHHEEHAVGIAFSPDGDRLATASFDDTARIWAIPSGQELLTMAGHTDDVNDVAFSPDGTRLVTASTDGTAKVWNTVTGEVLGTMIHGAWVFGADFSPDGRHIATGGQDGAAKVWDAVTNQELLTLVGHAAGVGNVAFSPDGTHLATGSDDGTTRVWDITPAGSREWLSLAGHNDLVFSVTYSPDGKRLASASWDGTAIVWDAASGRTMLTLSGHADRVSRIAFSPDGNRLATASYDGTAKIWNAMTGTELLTLRGHDGWVFGVAFSPDGTSLATAGADGTVIWWNVDTGVKLRALDAHTDIIFRITFAPDGRHLATASWDGTAAIWDITTGEEILTLAGHDGGVNQVDFNADGTRLATASFDGTARVWDAATGEELFTLSGHTDTVWDVAFSPDDSRLATVGFDGLRKIWDAASGAELLTLSGHVVGPELAFSPNGAHLATGGADGTVRVYVLPIEELMALARSRVTRSLTPAECGQFLHVDVCPGE